MVVQKNYLKSFAVAIGIVLILVAIIDRLLIFATFIMLGMSETFNIPYPTPLSLELKDLFLLIAGAGCIVSVKDRKDVVAELTYSIRHRTTHILLGIMILVLVYLIYPNFIWQIPLFIYFDIFNYLQFSVFVGILMIIPLILISNYKRIYKVIAAIVGLATIFTSFFPLIVILIFLRFPHTAWLESSAVLGEDYYYIAAEGNDFYIYTLQKCNSWGLECEELFGTFTGGQDYHVITNNAMREAYLFDDMILRFIDGQTVIFPYEQYLFRTYP